MTSKRNMYYSGAPLISLHALQAGAQKAAREGDDVTLHYHAHGASCGSSLHEEYPATSGGK